MPRVEILWCPTRRRRGVNGWAFPPAVDQLLQREFHGKRIGQLFGGLATFGVRLDLDATTQPQVIGDAWLPPFVRDAFDVVILDPPYRGIDQPMKQALLRGASWVARESVVWFHTQWIAPGRPCTFERGWLVRVGDSCAVRALQVFAVDADKPVPEPSWFTRGPAILYNRWLMGAQGLPFGERDAVQ